ncbi:MAG: phosphoesterase, partial [Phenylobacterium sp.]
MAARLYLIGLTALLVAAPAAAHDTGRPHRLEIAAPDRPSKVNPAQRRWLSGDHHVHSQYSVGFKPAADPAQPPTPIVGGDAIYP